MTAPVWGLPIAQQIVSEHHGTIEYVSDMGKGTTFTVKLSYATRDLINSVSFP